MSAKPTRPGEPGPVPPARPRLRQSRPLPRAAVPCIRGIVELLEHLDALTDSAALWADGMAALPELAPDEPQSRDCADPWVLAAVRAIGTMADLVAVQVRGVAPQHALALLGDLDPSPEPADPTIHLARATLREELLAEVAEEVPA